MAHTTLTGWGRTKPTAGEVVEVFRSEIPATIKEAGERGALMRGLGRSYGDAAQNGGGIVMRLMGSATDAILDRETATITVSATLIKVPKKV